MMYDWRYDNGGGHDWFGLGLMVIWWVFVFVAVMLLVRYLRGNGHHYHDHHEPHAQDETALDILKKRYARGEIDKKEYEEKRKDLGQ